MNNYKGLMSFITMILCLLYSSREFTASQFRLELKERGGFIPRYN